MLYEVKQLHGYKLRETNGEIGEVREVYFDDQEWCVRYLVVETGSWLFGRKALDITRRDHWHRFRERRYLRESHTGAGQE